MFLSNIEIPFYTIFSLALNYMFTPFLAPLGLFAIKSKDTAAAGVVLAVNSLYAFLQGVYHCSFWAAVFFTAASDDSFFESYIPFSIYSFILTSTNQMYMGYFNLAFGVTLILVYAVPQLILSLHYFKVSKITRTTAFIAGTNEEPLLETVNQSV